MRDLRRRGALHRPGVPDVPAIDDIVAWARRGRTGDRPLILCEYSHAMGNSNGSLADYVGASSRPTAACRAASSGSGRTTAWSATSPTAREFFAYGGQFGDDAPRRQLRGRRPGRAPTGHPHPAMREVASRVPPGRRVRRRRPTCVAVRVRVRNRRWFRDLSDLRADWELVGRRPAGATRPAATFPPVGPRAGGDGRRPDDAARGGAGPGVPSHLLRFSRPGRPRGPARGHEVASRAAGGAPRHLPRGRPPAGRRPRTRSGGPGWPRSPVSA